MIETPEIIRFELKPFQFRYVNSQSKFPAFIGGLGSGKTLSALLRAFIFSQETKNNLGLVCRAEYTDLRDSTMKDFERYTNRKINEQTKEVRFENGSVIMFRHAEELNTLKNVNLGWAFLEQAEELSSSDQFFFIAGRLRREGKRRSAWITANASGHNWIWDLWIDKKKPDFECFQATTFDNQDSLPLDYMESLKYMPERLYKQYVLNDHSVAEGLVWPEFDENIHTCPSFGIHSEWKKTIALDHGFAHPTAVLFGAVDFDGCLIIYNEHYEREKVISWHAERIKQIEPDYLRMDRIIDPSCASRTMQKGETIYSVIDEYLEYGLVFHPGQNDWQAGVNRVAELFKSGKIKIFRDLCPRLIQEIKNYKYKVQKEGSEKVEERPVKLNDDLCDAIRYLVSSHPAASEKPVPRSQDKAVPLAGELIESVPVNPWQKWNQ